MGNKRNTEVVSLTKGAIPGSYILHLTVGLQMTGIVLPYLISICKDDFDPPLPFISHAVGCNIHSGIFTCSMMPASFFGIILNFLFHVSIYSINQNQKMLTIASFTCCSLYFQSWILICAFPLPFTDLPNQFEWVWCVLWEHMIGALQMLGACVFFPLIQVFLCLNAHSVNSSKSSIAMFGITVAIIGICALFGVAFEELSRENYEELKTYHLPIKLSFFYTLTSTCEWSLIVSMWTSLGVLAKDLKGTEVRICLRSKATWLQERKIT